MLTGTYQNATLLVPLWTRKDAMPPLTQRLINSTPLPQTKDIVLWDTRVAGFGIRLWSGGKRTFFVRYRYGGKRYQLRLGSAAILSVDNARAQAQQVLAAVARGEDPAAQRRAKRSPVTVAALAERYTQEYLLPRLKPATIRVNRLVLTRYILPAIGEKRSTEVVPSDITTLIHSMRRTPAMANRMFAVCSHLFTLAERWGILPRQTNPAYGITKYREKRRTVAVSLEELPRLERALEAAAQMQTVSPIAIGVIRLLIHTGCRVGEITSLAWADIDEGQGIMKLRDAKTGARTVYLSAQAQAILGALPHTSQWVFPGKRPGRHVSNIQRPWERIRDQAGLPAVRLHDLRHTYASLCIRAGIPLPIVSILLGHKKISSTMIYLHVNDAALAAARLVGTFIEQAAQKEVDVLLPVAPHAG